MNVEREWSRDEIRRRWWRSLPYVLGAVIAGTVDAYFLSDFVTAILVGVTLNFCTLAGAALGLRLSYWYAELMNRRGGGGKEAGTLAEGRRGVTVRARWALTSEIRSTSVRQSLSSPRVFF